jgi:RNA polymerase sporulation-specific sigma factor
MSDAALVLRARGGDELAFRRLLDRHGNLVRLIAGHYFPPPGLGQDDLSQEAMVGFYKAVRDYRPDCDSGFRNFAEICIRRQVMTALTYATRRKHEPLSAAQSFDQIVVGDGDKSLTLGDTLRDDRQPQPHEVLEQRAEVATVVRTVRRMSETERGAVVAIASGTSYAEIASATGLGLKTIDNAAQRGKRKIRAALEAAA